MDRFTETEAEKLKRMYLLQEEKIALLEQIITEQSKTIKFLKNKLNMCITVNEQNVNILNTIR
tara:strand:- start:114 stop:302 length:189 start_codon:yes stop_codon:yes gene_type:complete